MDGYMTSFVRKDRNPREDYYYHSREEAEEHLNLFKNDHSGLYARIEVIDLEGMKKTAVLSFK